MFEYDRSEPTGYREENVYTTEHTTVRDVRYRGAGREIRAFLVEPRGGPPAGGVVYIHPAPGSRSTFLQEAGKMAHRSVASLLVDAPWSAPQFGQRMSGMTAGEARDCFVASVVDVRRGMDVLCSMYALKNLAVVGHSLGALIAGVLSGVDDKVKDSILMAGVGSFADVALVNQPSAERGWVEEYRRTMEPIDPIRFVSLPRPGAILFQFGDRDAYFPVSKFELFAAAAKEPKEVRWYDTNHFGVDRAGRPDRIAWLEARLGRERGPEGPAP